MPKDRWTSQSSSEKFLPAVDCNEHRSITGQYAESKTMERSALKVVFMSHSSKSQEFSQKRGIKNCKS